MENVKAAEDRTFDPWAWVRSELRIDARELRLWRKRFPLIASMVREDARNLLTEAED